MLNKVLAGIVATVAIAATPSAFAADMPIKAGPPVVAATYNWTGVYVGLNAGGGWTSVDYLNTANTTAFGDVAPGPPGFSHRVDGFVGGGQIGANWQFGNFVFGLEAMFDHSNMHGKLNPLRGGPPPVGQDDNFQTRIRSVFLGTARAGLAWDNALVYAKGGFAGGDVQVKVTDTVGVNQGAASSSDFRTGYTFGGGAEYGFRFAPGLSMAVEYNYVRLDSGSYELAGTAAPLLYTFNVEPRDMHLVMGRLNYRFSWFGLLH